mmetsp:Transcript_19994/g.46726  ORF Transcript_19994/g.46726 Transcript_19994/m.46726 type:complete len:231 (+) Transcript_19994:305-997(+)
MNKTTVSICTSLERRAVRASLEDGASSEASRVATAAAATNGPSRSTFLAARRCTASVRAEGSARDSPSRRSDTQLAKSLSPAPNSNNTTVGTMVTPSVSVSSVAAADSASTLPNKMSLLKDAERAPSTVSSIEQASCQSAPKRRTDFDFELEFEFDLAWTLRSSTEAISIIAMVLQLGVIVVVLIFFYFVPYGTGNLTVKVMSELTGIDRNDKLFTTVLNCFFFFELPHS